MFLNERPPSKGRGHKNLGYVLIKLIGWVTVARGRKFFKKKVKKSSLSLFKKGVLK